MIWSAYGPHVTMPDNSWTFTLMGLTPHWGCHTAWTAEQGMKHIRKAYKKADYKEPKDKSCLLTLHLKAFRS